MKRTRRPTGSGPARGESRSPAPDADGPDDLDLFRATSLAAAAKIPPEQLINRALAEEQPLLFRARFLRNPERRLVEARHWMRWSDAEEDGDVGAEPTVEAVLPLPRSRYVDFIRAADRAVAITQVPLPLDDLIIDLVSTQPAIRFVDLLVDEEVWEHFTGTKKPRASSEARTRQNDLRVIACFVRLAMKADPKKFVKKGQPKLSALAGALLEEAQHAHLAVTAPNTITRRLSAAMALAASESKRPAEE